MGDPASSIVKLACRNIWKVYGDNPGQYFNTNQDHVSDPAATLEKIIQGNHIPAAADVSFDVHEGEIFVIMGLSGSGKSTMVRCLSRLVEPTAGEIILGDIDLLKANDEELIEIRRHKMGMVFQSFGLLPHLSVLDNVAFPLKIQNIGEAERRRKAAEMIELVGLSGREDAFPRQLSGGQQQRVGIARSLAVEPELWFLDEPFSALDPLIRRQMQDEFVRLQTMLHKTIVFITHDFLEALKLADRIAIMKDGQVVQIGTPAEIVLNPATSYVAEFTSDVPLVRVITCGSIMVPATQDLDHSIIARPDTTLEELLPGFSGRVEPIPVVSDDELVGMVTPADVLQALAESEAKASQK
ncbi:MAG: betaine/proline/choline family ABC transporter ATP-binding protein [Gammaproteobacteria bacterium]|nr:betaine/proline/choline family ABC transporter ATP-binding protein [Gammaproteobacteria bacterium]